MDISLNWLNRYVKVDDISAEELQLLISFRRLSPQDQEDIITFMKIKASRNT